MNPLITQLLDLLGPLVLAQDDGAGAAVGIVGIILLLVYLAVLVLVIAVLVLVIAGGWKMYAKAGRPAWTCLIPIYNGIVLLNIVGRPLWWIILMLIPIVNLIIVIIVCIDLARAFGKETGFGLGLVFLSPIFVPVLGFGSATYQGPAQE